MNIEINATKESVRIIATLVAFYALIRRSSMDPAGTEVSYANHLVKELERK